jgi:predicted DNA-binding protein with PD1-like motif
MSGAPGETRNSEVEVQYQVFEDRYIVRLESGEAAIETLTALLRAEGIRFASLSAIGAVRWAELGYWNADTQEYEFRRFDEQMEVVSLLGNCSLKDGEPFLHVHCTLGKRDFSVIGGHLKEAQIHPTLEVWLRTESTPVHRRCDEATGLDLLQLSDAAPNTEGGRSLA